MEDLLMVLLECGSMDLSVLEGVGYDLGGIVDDLVAERIKPTLSSITNEIFWRGQQELREAVDDAIRDREEMIACADDIVHEELQKEVDELRSLDPDNDMCWYCNYLDTSCWFSDNEEIYRKYIPDAITSIEGNMGFEF